MSGPLSWSQNRNLQAHPDKIAALRPAASGQFARFIFTVIGRESGMLPGPIITWL
jgi:hypothetical protein